MLAMRAYQRGKHVDGLPNEAALQQAELSVAQAEEMYRIMAIANYEDRFVIPTTHREYAENAFNVRGGCGFSFGNGCSEGVTETSLFGSEKTHHPAQGGALRRNTMTDSICFTLRALAHLLRYPDAAMRSHLPEIHTALNAEDAIGHVRRRGSMR